MNRRRRQEDVMTFNVESFMRKRPFEVELWRGKKSEDGWREK